MPISRRHFLGAGAAAAGFSITRAARAETLLDAAAGVGAGHATQATVIASANGLRGVANA